MNWSDYIGALAARERAAVGRGASVLDQLDAANEDAHGRMPGEPGYGSEAPCAPVSAVPAPVSYRPGSSRARPGTRQHCVGCRGPMPATSGRCDQCGGPTYSLRRRVAA